MGATCGNVRDTHTNSEEASTLKKQSPSRISLVASHARARALSLFLSPSFSLALSLTRTRHTHSVVHVTGARRVRGGGGRVPDRDSAQEDGAARQVRPHLQVCAPALLRLYAPATGWRACDLEARAPHICSWRAPHICSCVCACQQHLRLSRFTSHTHTHTHTHKHTYTHTHTHTC